MENNNNKITGATFILINPSGEILMQLRDAKTKIYPNMWCFPGGTVKPGEDYRETLVREVKEEYGLDIMPQNFQELMLLKYSFGGSAKIFVCQLGSHPKIRMSEGAAFRWMKIEEIKRLTLGWEQNIILSNLEKFLRTQK